MVKFVLFIFLANFSLFAKVTDSILPLMDTLPQREWTKINCSQKEAIDEFLLSPKKPLRLFSFNMLFNLPISEEKLEKENQWEARGPRLAEYLSQTHADIIGSQELQPDQRTFLAEKLGPSYEQFGPCLDSEASVIFYNKERLSLLSGTTVFYVGGGHFVVGRFYDNETNRRFYVVNTHLAFGDREKRIAQAKELQEFTSRLTDPTLVTGDFNTFPFRSELELPFYDGDVVVAALEEGCLKDGMKRSLFGHFGPIASTNFCAEEKKSFCGRGTPGVLLDHIFVTPSIQVIAHGIDPAKVDGYFPSDHFPVVIDFFVLH